MAVRRTDLALEARELWQESAQQTTELPGVKATEKTELGLKVTTVEILDERGCKALGKPVGKYVTIDIGKGLLRSGSGLKQGAEVLSRELDAMLKLRPEDTVLVVGLGNTAVTPDSVGPRALENTIMTRHLAGELPEYFGNLRKVCGICPGVTATTGLESLEVVMGVNEKTRPDRVIVVDALAARGLDRLCSTIQLSDTGIAPGSGVGNCRKAFDKAAFGVPVVAIGVPTVVDVSTLYADISGESGEYPLNYSGNSPLIVTLSDIDEKIKELGSLIGLAIDSALLPELEPEDALGILH